MNPHVPGLAPYRIRRATIPAPYRSLLRGQWDEARGHELLGELAREHVVLYAALRWLHDGTVDGAVAAPTAAEADALIESLGLSVVRDVTLGMVVMRALRIGRCEGLDLDDFWSRSLAHALAARELAPLLQARDPIRCFLAGLFCELGQLVIAESHPDHYASMLMIRHQSADDLRTREREVFGIDRDTIACAFLRDVGLSRAVLEPMRIAGRMQRNHRAPRRVHDSQGLKVQPVAALMSDIITASGSRRADLWGEFVRMRGRLDLNRDSMNVHGDQIVNAWWAWGDLLCVPTRTLPGFAELSDWNERGREPVQFNGIETQPLIVSPEGSGLDVLLVEDDMVSQTITRKRLEKAGHSVRVANNGQQALDLLRQDPPQVVLCDLHMPEMNGVELCRSLRTTELGQRVFFIILTGEDDEERIVEAYEAGIHDFVPKTASPAILLARISAAHNMLRHWDQVDTDRRIIRAHCKNSRRQAARMRVDSTTDTLTGLHNRRFAMEQLREDWARSQRTGGALSVVMADIDHFKPINDQFGHDVGDAVLEKVAAVLRQHTRRGESTCRIGGEEFLVICSASAAAEAALCAERLRLVVEEHPIQVGKLRQHVTMSFGVAERSPLTEDFSALLKAADDAVYAAKDQGRNRVAVWPSMHSVQADRERLGLPSVGIG